MQRSVLRFLCLLTAVLVVLGIAASFHGQTSSNGDFTYIASPPRVALDPGTVIPATVPYCKSGSLKSLICYSPDFLRTAYNYPSGLNGQGQTIVIVDAFGSPTIENDLAVFDSTFGIPAPPSPAYATDFHDITLGNNQLAGTPVGFSAKSGYDFATGWGTPDVTNVVADLVACAKTAVCP